MSLTAKLEVNLSALLQTALDLSVAANQTALTYTPANFTSGTGLNQADVIFHDRRTLASAATESLNLYTQTDALGNTVTLAKVKALLIYSNASTAGDNLKIGGEGSGAAWQSFFQVSGTASDTANGVIGPGALFLIVDPSLAAWTVTNTTNHLLKIANAGSNSFTYDIVIIGTSA